MLTVRSGPAVGLVGLLTLLAVLGATVGMSTLGWVVGVTCGLLGACAVTLALLRSDTRALGPADHVTLARAVLACGAAAVVADAFVGTAHVAVLVTLAAVALALDAVDGWVARRTRTASTFGARFDGEVDAFLILVLSVYVARSFGVWVLAIGAARYLFAPAGWGTPWELPARPWRKVVAGIQGVVLAIAATGLLPRPLVVVALAVALALLGESFGRDVWWLWRLRRAGLTDEESARPARGRRRLRGPVLDVLAVLVVWFALIAPVRPGGLAPAELLRLPLEGLAVAALALVLPSWGRRLLAGVAGTLLALLTVLKVLDLGFFAAFDRPFDPVADRGYLGPAIEFVRDALGPLVGTVVLVAVACLVLAVLVGVPLAVGRFTSLLARHRRVSARVVAALVLVWAVLGATGLQAGPGGPVASTTASRAAVDHVNAVAEGVRDEQRFEAAAAAVDPFGDTAGRELLSGLRGKDVLLTFVESYGRSAVEGLPSSGRMRQVLATGTRRLDAAGYSARSAYLTSPTFGGFSWLAHATLQSGLWVDNEQRHDRLLSSERTTLTGAFDRAGWRTLAFMPSNKTAWPEGRRFYGFDEMYRRDDIDYRGPRFGWSTMPDQFALRALYRLVLRERDRAPVMAEVDLTSSHPPWSPLPRMVAWSRLGDGSVFRPIHERSPSPEELWQHPEDVPGAYVDSVAYSMSAVVSFVRRYGDDDLVVIVLGDHQPAAVVTGNGASRDVPISVISRDRAVLERISGWGWEEGLRPGAHAPVWRMDAFRDRFLDAFSVHPPSNGSVPAPRHGEERSRG